MVVLPDHNSVNELFNPTQKFLDLISQSNQSFDKMMTDTQLNEGSSNKFLHLEGLRYKFESDDDFSIKTISNDDHSLTAKDTETVENIISDTKDLVQSVPVFISHTI